MPNEDLKWVAEDCGVDVASALLSSFGSGITLYIPGPSHEGEKKIKIEDMPNDDMKLVAEKCGIKIARRLIDNFSQCLIYIPRMENTPWVREQIRKRYNGHNARRLACFFETSERFIYKCMKEKSKAH